MTFAQSLNGFADRVLDRTLGMVEAGACVPSNGTRCACEFLDTNCALNGHNTVVEYSCLGQCTKVLSTVCC